MPLTITLKQFLALIDGDDELTEERAWLLRNTSALGESTVIQPEQAAQIRALDPDGVTIHIQTYTLDATRQIHTAWHPTTWRESFERRRLYRMEHSEWRREQTNRQACIDRAHEVAKMLAAKYGLDYKIYAARFVQNAEEVEFDRAKFEFFMHTVLSVALLPTETPKTEHQNGQQTNTEEENPGGVAEAAQGTETMDSRP